MSYKQKKHVIIETVGDNLAKPLLNNLKSIARLINHPLLIMHSHREMILQSCDRERNSMAGNSMIRIESIIAYIVSCWIGPARQ